MLLSYLASSGRRSALIALAASGTLVGVVRSQAIRPAHTASRMAQLPAAGPETTVQEWAQANQPARPEGAAIAPVNTQSTFAPVAIPAAPAADVTGPALISLQFKDIAVADLITMIAEQGDVGIIVSDEVNTRLKNVNLVDQTPEQAIRFIAETSGYQWRKLDKKTYAIARTLQDLPPTDRALPVITPKLTDTMPFIEPRVPDLKLPELAETRRRDEPRIYSYLKIRNVTPRMIAWWLDPAHNPVPFEIQASNDAIALQRERQQYWGKNAMPPEDRPNASGGSRSNVNRWAPAGSLSRGSSDFGQFDSDVYTQSNAQRFGGGGGNNNNRNNRGGGGGAAGGGAIFSLPEGIESLVAVDPQNALLVLGTPEGIQQLEQIIGFLDRPLRQVEIEAQFVTVSTTFTKAFGIDFTSSNGPFRLNTTGRAPSPSPGSISLGFVRNNFRATLNALEAAGNAKTVAAPRVTAINNLPASITSTVATPITLTETTQNLNGGTTQSSNPANYILTSTGLNVTPTINNDDTVTVVFSPFVSANTPIAGQQAPQISTQNIFTIANVKDGDTIALGGLRTKRLTSSKTGVPILRNIPIIGQLFESHNRLDSEDDLIIFLTARIVRRVEDPVPGT